ncbi:transcriptional regulator GcvA [Shewanella surugensis]|uniref:Transcriptional regulator GcvA n=1 Tax=Shewanella surugensis TaxID=212020 RepID=A0ABT0LFB7_9GAMM|nr:transcriptional regulator GcvA [Shewanella surugensis]MCL1126027.1 transcriptional regulator GcvA [Shewanella surugensis]
MFQYLPPLNALRAFEAAARHLSFTLAGKELFVTHGAISKQVKTLENYLGLTLFMRLHRQLVLTDEGIRYQPHVQTALQSLNNATYDLKNQPLHTQTLSINVLPSLSISWLIPRIEEFKSQYPHLFVDLSIGDFPVDFSQQNYDIAIRSTTEPPRGMTVIDLMDEDLCLVCSPKLAKKLSKVSDINKMTLLKHTTRPRLWEQWADSVGVDLTAKKNFAVEHFYMLSQAAVSGIGMALIPRFFIEKELSEGSLVLPFHETFTSPYRYYILTSSSKQLPLKTQLFIDWLLALFSSYRHPSL